MNSFIGTLEFAEKCVRLNDAPFRASAFPWLTDIAATIDRARGATFVLMFPPQVFKSLFMQLRLARQMAVETGPALWYCKTGKESEAFSDTKLSRLLEACQSVQRKRFHDPDARGGKTLMKMPDMTLEMLGSDNRNDRNGKSGRDLFLDESWQYEPGTLREIIARSDSYEGSRRIIIGTTGPSVDDETDLLWQQSSRNAWRCVCPSCKVRVPLEFGEADSKSGMRWDSNEITREPDGRWRPQAAARTTRWVCPLCEAPHLYSPDLQRWMTDPANGAGYEQTNSNPSPRVFGWTGEAVIFRNWEDLVAEWLEASNAKALGSIELIEEFTRKKRCRAWDPSMVLKGSRTIPFGDYNMGDPWADEGVDENGNPLRFMTVDVQKDHYWVVIRQWSNKTGTWAHSRLLHFRKAFSSGELEDIRTEFKIEPMRVTMDCKWNDQAVYQICHRYGFTAVAGVDVRSNSFLHSDGVRRIYDEPRMMDAYAGKVESGHAFATRIQFSSIAGKFRLEMTRQSKGVNGEWVWSVPRNAPPEYMKQAWGEVMIRKRNPKGGWRTEFKEIGENHAFDCESVQCVVASIMGILGSEALESQDEQAPTDH